MCGTRWQATRKTQANTHAKHKQTRTQNTSKQTKHANKQTTSQKQDESRASRTRVCGKVWNRQALIVIPYELVTGWTDRCILCDMKKHI